MSTVGAVADAIGSVADATGKYVDLKSKREDRKEASNAEEKIARMFEYSQDPDVRKWFTDRGLTIPEFADRVPVTASYDRTEGGAA